MILHTTVLWSVNENVNRLLEKKKLKQTKLALNKIQNNLPFIIIYKHYLYFVIVLFLESFLIASYFIDSNTITCQSTCTLF